MAAPYAQTPAGLVAYLNDLAGHGIISGQFIDRGPLDPITAIQASTGEWLGMIGGDYWYIGSTATTADLGFNPIGKAYYDAGGLLTLIVSLPNPTTGGGNNDVSSVDAAGIVTSGTTTNTAFNALLDQVALGLADLAPRVVIFRPFQEANGNWFWWGAGLFSAAQFIALWNYTRTYLTVTKGLTNLVWAWSPNAGFALSGRTLTDTYPGAGADTTSFDLYTNNPASDGLSTYTALEALGKPVLLGEFGPGDPSAGNTSFDERTLINQIKTSMPKLVAWQQWQDGNGGAVGWGLAETTNAAAALADPYVINRGEVGFFVTATPTVVAPGAPLVLPAVTVSVRPALAPARFVPPAPPAFSVDDYTHALANLLPSGRIWRRDLASVLMGTLGALAPSYQRNTAAAAQLMVDAVPVTTQNLLPEWEATLGLPDSCTPAGLSVRQRQAAVTAKWAARGGQNAAYFIAYAAALGFPITITDFTASRFGQPFGQPFNGVAWATAWQVNAPTFTVQRFQFGQNSFGDPFASWGNTGLQCELQKRAPAHTTLIFSYQ